MSKILIVDDDLQICENYEKFFVREGYSVTVAYTGKDAIKKFDKAKPDIVLLDINMPELSGIKVCEILRERDKVIPILFFTASSAESDQMRAWGCGADDYIIKGTYTSVILKRIERMLERRRVIKEATKGEGNKIYLGRITVDLDTFEVKDNDELIAMLTRNETLILRQLNKARGRIYTREEILTAMYGDGASIDPSSFRSAIARLREKLGSAKHMIMNARESGYKLLP